MLATSYATIVVASYEDFYQKATSDDKPFGVTDQYLYPTYDTTSKSDLEKIQSALEECSDYMFNVCQYGNCYIINILDMIVYFDGGYINFGEDGVLGALDTHEDDYYEFEFVKDTTQNYYSLEPELYHEDHIIKTAFNKLRDSEKTSRLVSLSSYDLELRDKIVIDYGFEFNGFNSNYFNFIKARVCNDPKYSMSIACRKYSESHIERSLRIFGESDTPTPEDNKKSSSEPKKVIDEVDLRYLTLEQSPDEVVISISNDVEYTEIVKWISDEWKADPDLCSTIFNAIELFYNRPKDLLISLGWTIKKSVEQEEFVSAVLNEVYHEVKECASDWESFEELIRMLLERENSREILLGYLDEERKDAFMILDTSNRKTYLEGAITLGKVRKFLNEKCFQPEDGEDTELIMDNHKYIVFENQDWYIPESGMTYEENCISEFLVEYHNYM